MPLILRNILLIAILAGISEKAFLQNISFPSAIIEYHPAPGQFINIPGTGTIEAATGLTGKIGSPVSLGAYGGYIVFGFSEPIKNHPDNPYGIDFIIIGNAIDGNPEQGIVQIMKDENKNGLVDDTWYEVKGSDHFLKDFKKNYRIKYLNTGPDKDIIWTDNIYGPGSIKRNEFHKQPYYPMAEYFPDIGQDSLVFQGSLLPSDKLMEADGQVISQRSFFGYADNTPFSGLSDPLIPDNPYTAEIEGCGGDGIDISWAVDENDNYIELDEIDFIKIYTGINKNKGSLGEVSTEISGIIVVSPLAGVSGPTRMIMPLNIPASISAGSRIIPEALVFANGKALKNEKLSWKSSDDQVAGINQDTIFCHTTGSTILRAELKSDPEIFSEHVLRVFQISQLWFSEKSIALMEGEVKTISFKIFDDSFQIVFGPELDISVENPDIINALQATGKDEIIIEGLKEGYSAIDIYPSGSVEIKNRLSVHVYKPLPEVNCSFSLRNGERSVIPRHNVRVSNFDYSAFIDRKPEDYSLQTNFISLASVISSAISEYGFNNAWNTFKFRMDDKSNGELYLWQFVEDWEYTYGWGGSKEGGINKFCWAVTLNNKVYLNAFDKIPVKDGDQISINYVPDISSNFREIIIKELNEYEQGDTSRKFEISVFDHHPDDQGDFMTIESALNGERILFSKDGKMYDQNIITDNKGRFAISFESPGIYTLWPENYPEEKLIVNSITTSTNYPENINIKILPNPVSDELFILNEDQQEYNFLIMDISGNCLIEGRLAQGENIIREFKKFPSGIFLLKMYSAQKLHVIKIIKK